MDSASQDARDVLNRRGWAPDQLHESFSWFVLIIAQLGIKGAALSLNRAFMGPGFDQPCSPYLSTGGSGNMGEAAPILTRMDFTISRNTRETIDTNCITCNVM
jgi:hypothetical protein